MSGGDFSSRNLDDLLVGIDERDLVDLIEGQVDAERRHDLETMLIKRPELRRLVESMRHDRAALRAMPDEFCHLDIAASVRDVLEREALLGAAAAAEYAPAPIMIGGRLDRGSRFGARQFAFAAGLLLLVGGGVFFAWPLLNKPTPAGPNGNTPIAMSDANNKHDAAGSESRKSPAIATSTEKSRDEAGGVTPDVARPGALALNTEGNPETGTRSKPKEYGESEPIVSELTNNDSGAEPVAAAGELVGPELPTDVALARAIETPIDENRAAELALQGRLLVRVQGSSAAYVLSTSATRGSLGAHRVDRVEPNELASPVLAQVFEGTTTPEQIVWAADHAMPVYEREVVGPEGYVVEFAATPQGLAKLREELGGRVMFEELAEDAGLRPRIDPDAVLWWTLPPSSWAPRVAAPIILEH